MQSVIFSHGYKVRRQVRMYNDTDEGNRNYIHNFAFESSETRDFVPSSQEEEPKDHSASTQGFIRE